VAWWNTCFGTASFPELSTVQAEIARQHPRHFDFIGYSIPTTLLNNVGINRTRNQLTASRSTATATLADRITRPRTQQTLAERITFPDDEPTPNLAARVTYPAGHPSSLKSRITFPKKKQDQHRIQKKSHKNAASRRN
jgi:hypothetical protein